MSTIDTLNDKFALPDMGDYYYDAPDQQVFFEQMDKVINPVFDKDSSFAYDFYQEDPPKLGYDDNQKTYTIDISLDASDNDMQSIRGISVKDGDTISIDVSKMRAGDSETSKYIELVTNGAKAGVEDDSRPASKLNVRFACMNCAELPHFENAGPVSNFKDNATKTVPYDSVANNDDYVVSKYQCFGDDPSSIACNPAGSKLNGLFYDYSRENKTCNVVEVNSGGDTKYCQYYDYDGNRYILATKPNASNEYDKDTVADAGLARDIVVNAISKATEMRIVVMANNLNHNSNQPTSMMGNNAYDAGPTALIDKIFDKSTTFRDAGYNLPGLDSYGRTIAAIYLKINGKWINLNKLVIADTKKTVVNPDFGGTASSAPRCFDPNSYYFDRELYAEALYDTSSNFDDRAEVQKAIFGKTREQLLDWTLTIGDVTLFVPPTSIRCLTQTKAERFPVIRAKGTLAKSPTKSQRILEIDLFFNGERGINGYKFDTVTGGSKVKKGKNITYYMNGLRALYAQFRVAPFLPIDNNYVNKVLNIDAVTMINFSCETVDGFPKLIKATLQLAEFMYQIYMPEIPTDTTDYTNADEDGRTFATPGSQSSDSLVRDAAGNVKEVLDSKDTQDEDKAAEAANSIKRGDGTTAGSKAYKNYFSKQINYPLFRYYYQRLIRNGEELKDIDFLDDKFIKNTFGNRTNLIPCKFQQQGITFYIPNKEKLDQLKSAKIDRLQRAAQPVSLTSKSRVFAGDISKVKNEFDYISENENGNPISKLNDYLSNLETGDDSLYIMNAGSDGVVIRKATFDENGKIISTTYDDDCKEITATVNDKLKSAAAVYQAGLNGIKDSYDRPLCHASVAPHLDGNDPGSFSYDINTQVDANYISNDELNDLRTYASASSKEGKSAGDIFKDRKLSFSIKTNMPDISDKISPNAKDRLTIHSHAVTLGNKANYFQLSNNDDMNFVNMLNSISESGGVGGNEAMNKLKGSIDYVDANTLTFEAYNDPNEYIVQSMHMSTSNTFSQITLQSNDGYAPQYMGGTDVQLNITMFTRNAESAAAINALPRLSTEYAREYKVVLTAWPLKIESEFTKLFGITDTLIESCEVDTVPNFPNLYKIDLVLTSLDRSLRNREALQQKDLKNFHNLSKQGVAMERQWSYNQMSEFMSEAELYPDLELPTLQELSDNGFNFIRYSNKKRVYPDPDFYFTYSYVLVSQIIRETVLNALDSGAEMDIRDSSGKHSSGPVTQGMYYWEGNYDPSEYLASVQDSMNQDSSLSDEEKDRNSIIAHALFDFQNSDDKDRQELWTITPDLKVAFCEKRMLNHINDYSKQQMQQDRSGVAPAQENEDDTQSTTNSSDTTGDNKTTDTNAGGDGSTGDQNTSGGDGTQGENGIAKAGNIPTSSEKKTKEDEAYYNKVAEKKEAFTEDMVNTIDNILGQGIDESKTTLFSEFTELFKSFDTTLTSTQAMEEATNTTAVSPKGVAMSAVKPSDVNYDPSASEYGKWIMAVADALNSRGGVDYSKSAIKESGSDCWKATDHWVAKVINEDGSYTDINEDPKELSKNKDKYNETLGDIGYNAIQFSVFDIKFYTKDELEERFGYYAEISDDDVDRYGCYLADPYYRKADMNIQAEYVMNCVKSQKFAMHAFFRIALMYYKVLLGYNIMPSFEYDVFREALSQQKQIQAVINRMKEQKQQIKADAHHKSERANQGNQNLSRNGKERTGVNDSVVDVARDEDVDDAQSNAGNKTTSNTKNNDKANNNTTNTPGTSGYDKNNKQTKEEKEEAAQQEQDDLSSDIAQYADLFNKNKGAIDRGKIFIMLGLAAADGSSEFLKVLRERDYDTMNNLSHSALTSQPVVDNDNEKYFHVVNSFLKALVGREAIKAEDLSSSKNPTPQSKFRETKARMNAAAASQDPKKYLVHSFYDMVVHDCRGRMLRAFPTFYMIMIDEGRKLGRWKLHDNFYNVNSIANITISQSRKIPTSTAEITMSNYFNTYTTDDEDMNMGYTSSFSDVFDSIFIPYIKDDQGAYAKREEERRENAAPVERIRLQPGVRIHIRIGYGSDANALPISFNGVVAEVETGSAVKLVCQDDGSELCKPMNIEKEKASELEGIDEFGFGLSTMGENGATAKTIIKSLMCLHGGAMNTYMHDHDMDALTDMTGIWQNNPLGIYHFGNPDINICGEPEPTQNVFELGDDNIKTRYMTGTDDATKNRQKREERDKEVQSDNLLVNSVGLPLRFVDTWVLDPLSKKTSHGNAPKINFELAGKSVWDAVNICKSLDPMYYAAILPFHLRSTLFFGGAHDYYAYDYAVSDGELVEKRKPFQQYHIYDSSCDIIDNRIAVSTKDLKTVAIGMYDVEGFMNAKVHKKTNAHYFDIDIYPENQKTMIVDTKLFGEASRKLGVISDVVGFFTNGITNSALDRVSDDEGDVHNHYHVASKMTVDALKKGMAEMYQGQLTLIGDPCIKPYDRVLLNDNVDSIRGQFLVRDVVQVFDAEKGFKTVITPDLITVPTGRPAEEEMKINQMLTLVANFAMSTVAAMFITSVMSRTASNFVGALREFGITGKGGLLDKAVTKGKSIASSGGRAAKGKASSIISASKTANAARSKLGAMVKSASGKGSAAIEAVKALSQSAVGTGIKAIAKRFLPVMIISTALGMIGGFINDKLNERKCLMAFPLMKYTRPMVGGIDGNMGSVYGSPTFNKKDSFDQILGKFSGVLSAASLVLGDGGLYETLRQKSYDTMNKNQDKLDYDTLEAVGASHLTDYNKTPFNPAKPRMDVHNKNSISLAQKIYGVTGHSEQEINDDPHLQKMRPIINSERLKKYMDIGFFRVAAYEKGFTSDLADDVKCIYIKIDSGSDDAVPVNAIYNSDAESYDIPYLHRDAIGILESIIDKSASYMQGMEQTRDPVKWYEDNGDNFVTETSALVCGSEKNYENTGFSFVLTASGDKAQEALKAALDSINKQMEQGNAKTKKIQSSILTYKQDGSEFYVLVHPPKESSY